jgi:uroporphyrinogen decarboxylase
VNRIDRVLCAIAHRAPDKTPKGEFALEDGLVRRLLRLGDREVGLKERAAAMDLLHMDLTAVALKAAYTEVVGYTRDNRPIFRDAWGCEVVDSLTGAFPVNPALSGIDDLKSYCLPAPDRFDTDTVRIWKQETDFFVFALLNGGFSGAASLFGFPGFLVSTRSHPAEVRGLIRDITRLGVEVAERALLAGADGVIVADDIAYNRGTYLSPESLRELVLTPLADLVSRLRPYGKPVFFHSDGNLNNVLDDLVGTGIDGIHCLEPSAGMDIAGIKRQYGQKLCLMGNLDYEYLLPAHSPAETREQVREIIRSAGGGGFILSTCTGVLGDEAALANVLAMYDEAED